MGLDDVESCLRVLRSRSHSLMLLRSALRQRPVRRSHCRESTGCLATSRRQDYRVHLVACERIVLERPYLEPLIREPLCNASGHRIVTRFTRDIDCNASAFLEATADMCDGRGLK